MTQQQTGPAVTPKRRRWILLITAAVIIAVASSIAVYALLRRPDLAERDPAGSRACEILAAYQTGEISENGLVVSFALGEQAAKSATESIRATSSLILDVQTADLAALHGACVSEGVDMPPWVGQ